VPRRRRRPRHFRDLIDGKSVVLATPDVLDPPTGELLAKVPDIERDGMDAAVCQPPAEPFPVEQTDLEARRSILEKGARESSAIVRSRHPSHAEGGAREVWLCGKSLLFWMICAGRLAQSLPDVIPPNRALAGHRNCALGVVAASVLEIFRCFYRTKGRSSPDCGHHRRPEAVFLHAADGYSRRELVRDILPPAS